MFFRSVLPFRARFNRCDSWNSASRLFIRKWSRRLLKVARKQEIIALTSNYRSFVSETETTWIGRREGNDGGWTCQNYDVDINGTDGSACQTTVVKKKRMDMK
jgi:hypothetical protein